MRKAYVGLVLAIVAIGLAGCAELFQPQATVTGGLNSPSIDQAQAIPYNGPQARIAVLSFDDKSAKGYGQIGQGMAEMLTTELVNTGRFIVLERRELGGVMAEQDLARAGRIQGGTEAPTGQIEGAELLVTGAITQFEPNLQGGGGGIIAPRLPLAIGGGFKQSEVAIDLRVIDARTSRIVAATTVTGRASDIAGALGTAIGGGRSRLGIGLNAFHNTPMEKAVRTCLAQAVNFVVSRTPANYYHASPGGQPMPAPQPAPGYPPAVPQPMQPQPMAPQPMAPQPMAPQPMPPQPPQPQPQPQPEPQPGAGAALPAQVFVTLGSVRVYQNPDAASAMVATVQRGTGLQVAGEQGDWYAVQLPDGKRAWIMKAFTSTTQPN